MGVDFLRTLEDIQPVQRSLVGEKAFRLSQLQRKGYPVIPGITLDSNCHASAIAAAMADEPALAALWGCSAERCELGTVPAANQSPAWETAPGVDSEARSLQQLAARAGAAIRTIPTDDILAALTPAIAAWPTPAVVFRPSLGFIDVEPRPSAGVLRAHIARRDRPEELTAALHALWADLCSARSLFYWHKLGIALRSLRVAVLVQPLLAATAAGQVRATERRWDIEAVWGLGQSLVRGEVAPEHCELDPRGTGISKVHRPGQQTHYYQPSPERAAPVGMPLTATATFPILTDERLQSLRVLLGKLTVEVPDFDLEWTWGSLAAGETPRFYISEWSPRAAAIPVVAATAPSQTGPIRGLPAAPGRAIAPVYVLEGDGLPATSPESGCILAAAALTPAQLALLDRASGVILEDGGLASHGAILARELGIPSVVGVADATARLQAGQWVALDGDRGEIDLVPAQTSELVGGVDSEPTAAAPMTLPPSATQLLVNISQPESAAAAAALPVDGVGLLRGDLLLLAATAKRPLTEWLQPQRRSQLQQLLATALEPIVASSGSRPVYYRACDWLGSPEERPWLGQRGTGRILQDPTLFDVELAAISQLHQKGHDRLQLMLPFVRSVEEFDFCRQRAIAAGWPHPRIWIMAEVPSVLLLLSDYAAAGIAGIAIGTNDLTQLLLGVDRETASLGLQYDERHPAVLKALQQLIERSRELGLPCSICGQIVARFPETIDDFVRWGVTALSVEPAAVSATATAIARAEQRLLLEAARRQLQA